MAVFVRIFILIAPAAAVATAFGVWHTARCVRCTRHLFVLLLLFLLLLSSVYMAGGVERCRLNEIT